MKRKGWSGSPKHSEKYHAGEGRAAARSTAQSPGKGKSGMKVNPDYDRAAMARSGSGGKPGRPYREE